MSDNLLYEGLILMAAGMGTVFVFLAVLVVAMTLMSRIAVRFQPSVPPGDVSEDEIAAIGAALARHRRIHRN